MKELSEEKLWESQERFRLIFEGAAIGIALADMEGHIVDCNSAFQKMLGYSGDELRSMLFINFTHPDDVTEDMTLHKELMSGERDHFQMEKRYIHKDGGLIWARLTVSLFRDAIGEPRLAIGMVENITEYKQVQESLMTVHQQLLDIVEFLPDATFVIDRHKKVIAWNKAMEQMTGISKQDILRKGDYIYAKPFYGCSRPILIDFFFLNDPKLEKQYEHVEKKENVIFAEAYVPLAFNGNGAFVWATASPLFDKNGNLAGAIETIRDITEKKRIEERLQYLATHDSLTNLPNRYSLEEYLKRAVLKAKHGRKSALLLIDIDNFKLVNDTLGHAAGDEALISLTNILSSNLREHDLLVRLGGDEFAVLLEGVNDEKALIIAEKLRKIVDEGELCLVTHNQCFNLTISIGIVIIDGTLDFEKLLSHADTAIYSAKEEGRNKVVLLEVDDDTSARFTETNLLIAAIKNAPKENMFVLFFQPVVSTSNGKIIHHEALIRLKNKAGELIYPGKFIPVAEQFGLMPQVDRWLVQSSLDTLAKYPDLNLFINLSGKSLGDDNLLKLIETRVNESGLEPSRLSFEITETAAVKDFGRAEQWIRRLKKLGCSFALDDFGIGFSSFSYLRLLPVDYLKIDGSYVRNLETDHNNRAIVHAMNSVARSLGMKTIAEFVENENILKILKELEIDYVQGYYLGRPSPVPKMLMNEVNFLE